VGPEAPVCGIDDNSAKTWEPPSSNPARPWGAGVEVGAGVGLAAGDPQASHGRGGIGGQEEADEEGGGEEVLDREGGPEDRPDAWPCPDCLDHRGRTGAEGGRGRGRGLPDGGGMGVGSTTRREGRAFGSNHGREVFGRYAACWHLRTEGKGPRGRGRIWEGEFEASGS